jgi:prepilin-type N-terminal cleavage/methylation domain-containing protein
MHTLVRGFTLIELILVVAIIGVLASIVIASFASARTSAKVARTQQELKQLAEAMFWAKSNSELGLPQITGYTWSAGPCFGTGDLRGNGGVCYTRWVADLSAIELAGGGVYGSLTRFDRDPWGSPYLLDENERDVAPYYCNPDNIYSAGPDGLYTSSDDVSILVQNAFPLPAGC